MATSGSRLINDKMRKDELIELINRIYEKSKNVEQNLEEIEEARQRAEEILGDLKAHLTKSSQVQEELSKIDVEDLKEKADAVDQTIDSINEYHDTLFIDDKEQEQVSVKTEIDNLVLDTKNTYEEWERRCLELEKEIEGLLPGATAAGLASNFRKSKMWASVTGWFFLAGFLVSAFALFCIYRDFVFAGSGTADWMNLIIKLPVGFPIIWIAWFCQRSVAQSKKLQETYNHKVNIMALYQGFSKAIQSTKNGDESSGGAVLTTGTIKEILVNPAELINDFKTPVETLVSRNSSEKKEKKSNQNKDEEQL